MKQALGWTAPEIRRADTADLWTWLISDAHVGKAVKREPTLEARIAAAI